MVVVVVVIGALPPRRLRRRLRLRRSPATRQGRDETHNVARAPPPHYYHMAVWCWWSRWHALRAAASYRTTLRNKDRIFDSTFPTLPERRGTQPGKRRALVASCTQHGTVDDINVWQL